MKSYLALFCSLLLSSDIHAQSLVPDPGFGNNGVVITPESGKSTVINSTALQSDGRIIAAGEYFNASDRHCLIARYLPDGTPDPSFGVQGKVMTSVGWKDGLQAVIVQADGKITAAGNVTVQTSNPVTISSRPFLIRYLPDGTPDSAFGINGVHHLDILNAFPTRAAAALAQLPDGHLLMGGSCLQANSMRMMLVCLEPDGSYDQSFGSGGMATFSPQSGQDAVLFDLAHQPDGKVVIGGYSGVASLSAPPNTRMALMRLLPTGLPDPAFGTSGAQLIQVATGNPNPFDVIRKLRIRPDGKIVAAGASDAHLALVQLNTDGTPDPAFGQAGIVSDNTRPVADGLSVLSDGRLLVSGLRTTGNNLTDVTISRFSATGVPDAALGTVVVDQSDRDRAYALTIQPDNKVLLAGHSGVTSGDVSFTLWRFADSNTAAGTAETAALRGLRLYPNPSGGDLYVSLPAAPARALSLCLFDLQGRLLLRREMRSAVTGLSLSGIPAGTYLLRVSHGKAMQSFKVSKQ